MSKDIRLALETALAIAAPTQPFAKTEFLASSFRANLAAALL